MKISLVSSFYDIPNEIHVLNLLFCNGLTTFHLRKDLECKHLGGKETYTEDKIRNYIESVHQCFRDRIILHSHFHLVKEYGLLGAHFTKKYSYEDYLRDNNLQIEDKPLNNVGFSLHSTAEIIAYANTYDYLFLSPVFDSISNIGYRSKFSLTKLKKFMETEEINSEIMALGGMNTTKIAKVKDLGFNGLSLLGFIWSKFDEDQDIAAAVDRFKQIIEIRDTLINTTTVKT
ncbi:thiamine phosphate synthase [Flavobacteriaceae bacterium MHTCC 0001]